MSEGPASALPEEERSRAGCYALLSRLFYAAPDAPLLAQLGGLLNEPERGDDAPPDDVAGVNALDFMGTLRALQQAAREAVLPEIRQDFDDLFAGAGRAAVTPYTAAYSAPHAADRHLLALRDRLASWGLERRSGVFEVEDHVAAVCDVMRWLIESEHPIAEQQTFFLDFVYPGVSAFSRATKQAAHSPFYMAAADWGRVFVEIEKSAFDLHTPE